MEHNVIFLNDSVRELTVEELAFIHKIATDISVSLSALLRNYLESNSRTLPEVKTLLAVAVTA